MPWFGDDGEGDDDEDENSDREEDEERDTEIEQEQGDSESASHMASDSHSWTSDDSGCCTELDSDYGQGVSSLRYRLIDRPCNLQY